MKVALFHKQSGKLKISEKEMPVVGPKDVLVRIHYCSFCHHDLSVIEGLLKRGVSDEVVLGHEISGVIQEIGSGVENFSPGDRVASLLTNSCGVCSRCNNDQSHRCDLGEGIGHSRDGGFAEYIAVSENSVFKIQDQMGLKQACMLACPVGVIEEAFGRYKGKFGIAVISGSTGGLGIHGLQKSASLFDRVIAVTTDSQVEDRLVAYGATDVVVYDPTEKIQLHEIIMAITEDEGADLYVDTVGSLLINESLGCMAQYGCMMLLGDIHGMPLNIRIGDMLFKDLTIICSTGTSKSSMMAAERNILNGDLHPVIFDVIGLEHIEYAHTQMKTSAVIGRILIDMIQDS